MHQDLLWTILLKDLKEKEIKNLSNIYILQKGLMVKHDPNYTGFTIRN